MKKTYVYPQIDCVYIGSDVIATSLYQMDWSKGEPLDITEGN